jgi:hypothetical protein
VLSTLAAGALGFTACGAPAPTDPVDLSAAPPGPDVSLPFAIDRGDDGASTPGTYKGLWLRLTSSASPAVTAVDGIIGVVCIGMSNANQECADFITRRNGEYATEINPAVRVVNCAVGGHAIERWIDPAFDATLWDACIANRLPAAGVRLDQVRVLYHKAANQFTTAGGGALPSYPSAGSDYENFRANLSLFAARVAGKFPAVQAVYSTSRSYGGFAGNAGRGEPLSYEEGHALNTWLRDHPSVQGVWYGWGPYLWAASCDTGILNGGGVCYDRQDYVTDGVHPSASGQAKVSALIHARWLREGWYQN